MAKKTVLIIGKLPPPYIGPAVATKIILNSRLKENFNLLHLNTTVNKSIDTFGKGGVGKLLKNISIYFRLFKILLTNKVHVIVLPISQTTLGFVKDSMFILIAALFPTKIVLQLRGSNFKNWIKSSNSLTKVYVRFCFKRASRMIVLGNNLKYLFMDYFSEDEILVVPNGCDIVLPCRSKTYEVVHLLYFANFLPSKGIKELIESIILLKNKGIIGFELSAVGAWDNEEYRSECLNLVESNQLPVNFSAPKSGDAKWQTFADSDLFVFTPNMPEGHPWVIVEALASGLPIISTDQGAIVESVLHGHNGYIVNGLDSCEIAERIEELLRNDSLRNEMGRNGKLRYLNNFTESQMVKKFTKVFESVLV